MSFSTTTKQELCKIKNKNICCDIAQLYGMFLFSRKFGFDGIVIQTECQDVSVKVKKVIRKIFNFEAEISEKNIKNNVLYTLNIDDPKLIRIIMDKFGYKSKEIALRLNYNIIENECCHGAFLRGMFLAGGYINNPSKGYHFEFSTPHYLLTEDICTFLKEKDYIPGRVLRKSNYIIYFKESEHIEDLLTVMGATNAAFEVMNNKIIKEIRNNANRVTNCDTANITKTVNASNEHFAAIKKIIDRTGSLDILPEKLKETANLRLQNPEASLTELSEISDLNISKSTINYRLRKIIEFADKL